MVLGQKPFIWGKIHLFFFSRLTEGCFVLGKQAKKTRGTGKWYLLDIVTRPNKTTALSEVHQTLLQYILTRQKLQLPASSVKLRYSRDHRKTLGVKIKGQKRIPGLQYSKCPELNPPALTISAAPQRGR